MCSKTRKQSKNQKQNYKQSTDQKRKRYDENDDNIFGAVISLLLRTSTMTTIPLTSLSQPSTWLESVLSPSQQGQQQDQQLQPQQGVESDLFHSNWFSSSASNEEPSFHLFLRREHGHALQEEATRHLTFIEDDEVDDYFFDNSVPSATARAATDGGFPNTTTLVVGFAILAALFAWTALLTTRVVSSTREFYQWNAIRLIFPTIQWFMVIECATLAVDVVNPSSVVSQWAIGVYMLESTIAPGIFLSTFVVTFLAYRTRSIPFCLVYRGPTRGTTFASTSGVGVGDGLRLEDDEEALQPLVRPATMIVMIRLFTLAIFVVSLVVNFDVVWTDTDLAGRTGWRTLFRSDQAWNASTLHIFLALLPLALVSLCCFYFAILLWRYGTTFAMIVYPSGLFNPWMTLVFGCCFLVAGQIVGPELFPLLSNAGILLYCMCLLRVLYEVRYDIKQASDLGLYLDALGNDIVAGSVAAINTTTTAGTTAAGTTAAAATTNSPIGGIGGIIDPASTVGEDVTANLPEIQ